MDAPVLPFSGGKTEKAKVFSLASSLLVSLCYVASLMLAEKLSL